MTDRAIQWEGIDVPPVYEPPLSDAVVYCAQRIAGRFLQGKSPDGLIPVHPCDSVKLTLYVRTAMNRPWRPAELLRERPTLDDQSIIAGIVRAINDHGS